MVAICAGVLDWRYRRIPNWLTLSGLVAGVGVNTILGGWPGMKASLLGALLGLGLLLPFVLLRSLGAGDWKLAGALGAILGSSQLLLVLAGSVLVAGVMAIVLVIYKRRFVATLRNMGTILVRLLTGHPGDPSVSLDNPDSLKVPYGVALAVTVLLYGAARVWGVAA